MRKNAGITLVALVITIIILLILAGVAISMITGGEGLFAKTNSAATKYNQAAKNEAEWVNQLLNGNYTVMGDKEPPKEPEVPTTKSHVRYYADIDADGTVDGIIFADLAVGGSGQWIDENGAYTIPVKTGLKEYYVSKKEHEGVFGTKDVLTPKEGSTGEDRFYIMALENFGGATNYTWYNEAFYNGGRMTDYATATSVEFGKGRGNTDKMIQYWNNKTYGAQNTGISLYGYKDMWGEIQGKVAEGWFVPSKAEWAAFAQELGITDTNFRNYGLSGNGWSSSQGGTRNAWGASFSSGYMYNFNVGFGIRGDDCVRLATTF